MSPDDKEFNIPFEDSRKGRFEQEEKALGRRLGEYLASRAIDRPSIGRGRRNRRGGFDVDVPTGGKPGSRTPTGSRRDFDGDGWADEGTTKPVWVGIDGQEEKPKGPSADDRSKRFSSGMEQIGETETHNYGDLVASKTVRSTNPKARGEKYRIIASKSGTVYAFTQSDVIKHTNLLVDRFNDLGRNPFNDKEGPVAAAELDIKDVLRTLLNDKKTKPKAVMHVWRGGRGSGENFEVLGIETQKSHRRRGLATELFNFHREVFPEHNLQHSNALTDDGRAFADATPTSPISSRLASGADKNAKLNIVEYGKNKEYAQVSSFELNGKTYDVTRGGDAVPGGYNGYIAAFDGDKNVGYIDYQMATDNKKATIAMIFTEEEYRRQGVAEALLDSFITENPDYEVSPGMTTEDGGEWWRSVTGGNGPIRGERREARLGSGKTTTNPSPRTNPLKIKLSEDYLFNEKNERFGTRTPNLSAEQLEAVERVNNNLEATGLPFRWIEIEDASGNKSSSPIFNFSGRPIVILRVGGMDVPFYRSTGMGGKDQEKIPSGKWYPFWGYYEPEKWFIKDRGMENYYRSAFLELISQKLDDATKELPSINRNLWRSVQDLESDKFNPDLLKLINSTGFSEDSASNPFALDGHINNSLKRLRNEITPDVRASAFSSGRSFFQGTGREQGDESSRLSSGRSYEELVGRQPEVSEEKQKSIQDFSESIRTDILSEPDVFVERIDAFGEVEENLDDTPERKEAKKKIHDTLAKIFSGEIELENDIIITAKNGEKINLGKTVIVEAKEDYVSEWNGFGVKIQKVEDFWMKEQEERGLDYAVFTEGGNAGQATISLRIKPTKEAAKRLHAAGAPESLIPWDKNDDADDPVDWIELGSATRDFVFKTAGSNPGPLSLVHNQFVVAKDAQGFGIGSAFNARNEKIYESMGVDVVFASALSNEQGFDGIVHWAKNGFTWGGTQAKQDLISVIDAEIKNPSTNLFTSEEKNRIASLYRYNPSTDLFETEAQPEEFVKFAKASELFKAADTTVDYVRPIKKTDRSPFSSSSRLSSGNRIANVSGLYDESEKFSGDREPSGLLSKDNTAINLNGELFDIKTSQGDGDKSSFFIQDENGKKLAEIFVVSKDGQLLINSIDASPDAQKAGVLEAILDSILIKNPQTPVYISYESDARTRGWWRHVTNDATYGYGLTGSRKNGLFPKYFDGEYRIPDGDYMFRSQLHIGESKPIATKTTTEQDWNGNDVPIEWSGEYFEIGGEKIAFGAPEDLEFDDPSIKNIPLNPYIISGLDKESAEGREIALKWASAIHGADILVVDSGFTPTNYVSALLYAATRGDKDAEKELGFLAERSDTLLQQIRGKQLKLVGEIDEKKALPMNSQLVHQTSFKPPVDENGYLVIKPLEDYPKMAEDGREITVHRTTLHWAINHLAEGHIFRRETEGKSYIVITPLDSLIEQNPGSLDNLSVVDTATTPPPGDGIRLAPGTFKVIEVDEGSAREQVENEIRNAGSPIFIGGEFTSGTPGADEATGLRSIMLGVSGATASNIPGASYEKFNRANVEEKFQYADFPSGTAFHGEASKNFILRMASRELNRWTNFQKIKKENNRSRLSSGATPQKPSYPREPTYGPLIGGAEDRFSTASTWEEFNEIYKDTDVVWLDYETTGLEFGEFRETVSRGKPVQIGAVKVRNGKVVDRMNVYVNPEEPLGEWSRENLFLEDGSKVTDEFLAEQISIREAHEMLASFAGENSIFGVQNALFDKNVLEDALKESGIDWRPSGYIDTRDMSDLTIPKWNEETDDGPFILDREGKKKPSNSLKAITEYLGVELGDKHHSADADAEAAANVMQAIIDNAIEKGWSTDALDKNIRDAKIQKENEKFKNDLLKFESDRESYISDSGTQERLSSGASKIIRGNKNLELANASLDSREGGSVSEDDERFFDENGEFNSGKYEDFIYQKEEEISDYFYNLSQEVNQSLKDISEKNYPDKNEPERFKQAKIQIAKAAERDHGKVGGAAEGYSPSLVIARESDGAIVGIANFDKNEDSIYIHNIASFGQEIGIQDMGASMFGQILKIADKENLPITLEATPGSEQYWRSLGFKDIDREGLITSSISDNKFLALSKEDVRKLNRETLSSGKEPTRYEFTPSQVDRLDRTMSFADPEKDYKRALELYFGYKNPSMRSSEIDDAAMARAIAQVFGDGVTREEAYKQTQERKKRFYEDEQYKEELRQQHIEKFGYAVIPLLDKDGIAKKTFIEIHDDAKTYESLISLRVSIQDSENKENKTKALNAIKKLQDAIKESNRKNGKTLVYDSESKTWNFVSQDREAGREDRLSSGAGVSLSDVFDEEISPLDDNAGDPDELGRPLSEQARDIAARRVMFAIEKAQGIELNDGQKKVIQQIVPNLMEEVKNKTLLEVELDKAFEETGENLLKSISIDISSDGTPFVSAAPIPQLAEQIPDKRDWRNFEIPKLDDVLSVVNKTSKDGTVFFRDNAWFDSDGNIVARKVLGEDGSPKLEYESESARTRFPLLEMVAPKGYVIGSDSIGLPSLKQDTLPGEYGRAWKKHGEFLAELARRAGENMGDEELFMSGSRITHYASTYLNGYIGGLTNPSKFNMGLQGEAQQYYHDLFGHLGTGRGFDRHGEWANDIAMMSMVDHPDSPLTPQEKLAVKHLHYMMYSSMRIVFIGRADEIYNPNKENNNYTPRNAFDITAVSTVPTSLETRVYAGNFNEVIDGLVSVSPNQRLSSGRKPIYEADEKDVELALAYDSLGVLDRKEGEISRLSSGRERRPLIPMRAIQQAQEVQRPPVPERIYKYGQKDQNGNVIRKTNRNWLKGLSAKQMANVLVPESKEQLIEMWMDDFVGEIAIDDATRKSLLDYFNASFKEYTDFNPENNAKMRSLLTDVLSSNRKLKWAFEEFGAPSFIPMSTSGADLYESDPQIIETLNRLKEMRGLEKRPYVRGISSAYIDAIFLNPRALVDLETTDGKSVQLRRLMTEDRNILPSDAHVDDSLEGTIVHEWGHWLHARVTRDIEFHNSKNRKYYGSGDLNDDRYAAAWDVAERYREKGDIDNERMTKHQSGVELSDEDEVPMLSTSYGHVNLREAIAEGMVAVLHKNDSIQKEHINKKLREDIYTLLGIDDGDTPWDSSERLSSGAAALAAPPSTGGRMRRLLNRVTGQDEPRLEEQKKQERPQIPKYEPKTQNLKYFRSAISQQLREMEGTVPTETIMIETAKEEVVNFVIDQAGTLVGSQSPASILKGMIARNVADSTDVSTDELIALFDGIVPNYETDRPSSAPFFMHGSNFGAVSALLKKVKEGSDSRFVYNAMNGKITDAAEVIEESRRHEVYQEKFISKLENFPLEELLEYDFISKQKEPGGIVERIYGLDVPDRIGSDDVNKELVESFSYAASHIKQIVEKIKGISDPEMAKLLKSSGFNWADTTIDNPVFVLRVTDKGFRYAAIPADRANSPENLKELIEQINAYGSFNSIADGFSFDDNGKIIDFDTSNLFVLTPENIDSEETKKQLIKALMARMSGEVGVFEGKSKGLEEKLKDDSLFLMDASTEDGANHLRYAMFSDFIHTWAISTNDSNPVALAIQNIAREMFNTELAAGWRPGIDRKISGAPETVREKVGAVSIQDKPEGMPLHQFDGAPLMDEPQRAAIRKIMQSIYDATQKYYEERGITHVPVWRGMRRGTESSLRTPTANEAFAETALMRPLSSWTVSPRMAHQFSSMTAGEILDAFDSEGSIIMKGYVPVSDIFSNTLTGFGCMGEDEVVLLGRPIDVITMSPLGFEEGAGFPGEGEEIEGPLAGLGSIVDTSMDEFYRVRSSLESSSRLSSGANRESAEDLIQWDSIDYDSETGSPVFVTMEDQEERMEAFHSRIAEDWSQWDPCREIRNSAYELAGIEAAEADPNIGKQGGFWGNGTGDKPGESPTLRKEMARYVMGYLVDQVLNDSRWPASKRSLFRAVVLTDTDREAFFETMSPGNIVDIPLTSFSDAGPDGGEHVLQKFGRDALIELVDFPASYYTDNYFDPIYDDQAEYQLMDELRMYVDDLRVDNGESQEESMGTYADELEALLDTYDETPKLDTKKRSELREQIQDKLEETGFETEFRWSGKTIDEDDTEFFYMALDDIEESDMIPREYVSGGRLEVLEVSDDESGLYGKIIKVRQLGVFDPENKGEIIPRTDSSGSRLSSGKKKTPNKSTSAHDKEFKEKFGQEVPEGDGNCFSEAFIQARRLGLEAAKDLSKAYTNIRVVHGYPLGTGGEAEGLRFPHAWAEYTERGVEFVLDYSNGNRVDIPKQIYYMVGNIDEQDTRKYSVEDALQKMVENEHYGPW